MKIIYPNPDNTIAIIFPTGSHSLQDTAKCIVPAGVPYLIVNDNDLPADWSTSEAWQADFSSPDGHGIGPEAWFAKQAAKEQSE